MVGKSKLLDRLLLVVPIVRLNTEPYGRSEAERLFKLKCSFGTNRGCTGDYRADKLGRAAAPPGKFRLRNAPCLKVFFQYPARRNHIVWTVLIGWRVHLPYPCSVIVNCE